MNVYITGITLLILLLMVRADRHACEAEEYNRKFHGAGAWPPEPWETAPGWNGLAYLIVNILGFGLAIVFR